MTRANPRRPRFDFDPEIERTQDNSKEGYEGLNPAVTMPDFEAEHFELKPVMFNMLNTLSQFGGTPTRISSAFQYD
ncbi:hypothetical protein GQ457_11G033220 [Hibiscus cannabinus]